jgi:hypothetical protein
MEEDPSTETEQMMGEDGEDGWLATHGAASGQCPGSWDQVWEVKLACRLECAPSLSGKADKVLFCLPNLPMSGV